MANLLTVPARKGEQLAPRRGEIYLLNGCRVLVVSNSRLNTQLSTVQIVPVTDDCPKFDEHLNKNRVLIDGFEILETQTGRRREQDGFVLVEQVTWISKEKLQQRIGRLDGHALDRIDKSLLFVLGLENGIRLPQPLKAPLGKIA